MEPKQIAHYVQLLFLSIAWLSVLCCLIRTDYNFPFALFCYYLWISRDDKANSLMLMVLNGVLIVVDIIWLLSVGSIWTSDQKDNPVWGHLHGLHEFAIFISVVNLILKVAVFGLINMYRQQQAQPGTSTTQDQQYQQQQQPQYQQQQPQYQQQQPQTNQNPQQSQQLYPPQQNQQSYQQNQQSQQYSQQAYQQKAY